MTIADLVQKEAYNGDGTANALAFPHVFRDATDLEVVKLVVATGNETTLVLNTHYTVTGGNWATGSVVPLSVRPVTDRWVVTRRAGLTQGTALPQGSKLPSVAIERQADRLTHIAQDLREILDRTMRIPVSDDSWIGKLPPKLLRASKALMFGVDGEPVVGNLFTPGALVVSAFIQTLLDDLDAATAAATLGVMPKIITTRGDLIRGGIGGVPERLVKGTSGQYVRYSGSDDPEAGALQLPDLNLNFRFGGMLFGFGLANNAGDALNDIDIALGACRNSANAAFIGTNVPLVKRLDALWAAGTNQGGRASVALAADTWYHVFAIAAWAYGPVDVGFDTSLTAANLLADSGYTLYRRIGSVKTATGSTDILAFSQTRDRFLWADPPLDVNGATIAAVASLHALTTPPGVKCDALINVSGSDNATNLIYVSSPDANDEVPSLTAAPLANVLLLLDGGGVARGHAQLSVRTNTSRQVRARALNDLTGYIATLGWLDRRGEEAS